MLQISTFRIAYMCVQIYLNKYHIKILYFTGNMFMLTHFGIILARS